MSDHEKRGLLSTDNEDALEDLIDQEDSDGLVSSDPLDSSDTVVHLEDDVSNTPSSSNSKKTIKKKKKKKVKKTAAKKREALPDGVDQAPVHPDEIENDAEGEAGYETHAFDESTDIESHASLVTQILVPVCITMALVIAIVKLLNPSSSSSGGTALYFENTDQSNAKRFGGAILNALIFVGMMIVVTVIFVVLYRYRCLKIIYGWLGLSTILLMGGGFGAILWQLVTTLNTNMDWITFAFIIWNFGAVGMTATFWHAPIKINQKYMIAVSAIMAILFTKLPEWSTWVILAVIAIYDLFAVLCPRGPLRVLVETAQERNEPIPALLYNAFVTLMASTDDNFGRIGQNNPVNGNNDDNDDDDLHQAPDHQLEELDLDPPAQDTQQQQTTHQDEEFEIQTQSRGVKLGLGDFVFYSVLVGRAAMFDMLTVFSAFIGIITGLFGTILLLALWKKALPALPLSIFFGVIFFFSSKFLLLPFASALAQTGIVV